MTRLAALFLACLLAAPAMAQSAQEVGQMRVYIQQLEERVRQLTGENERLGHELSQLRAQFGQPAASPAQDQTGTLGTQQQPGAAPYPVTGAQPGMPGQADVYAQPLPSADQALAAPPRDLGSISVSPDDPLIAPDGIPAGPIDLSVMAGGGAYDPNAAFGAPVQPGAEGQTQTAALPNAPSTTALSGSPRDEYDLAYGYVLTGDYDLAEQSFKNWLAAFPSDPQAVDAQFWLGESHYQQGEYRDAANAFLAVYKTGQASKGPDALLKLGMSLAALGEKDAACATLGEVGRKFPDASAALMSRVHGEEERAGC
jgi:tol-pal system protein YbgF